jgi:hypothetical protein
MADRMGTMDRPKVRGVVFLDRPTVASVLLSLPALFRAREAWCFEAGIGAGARMLGWVRGARLVDRNVSEMRGPTGASEYIETFEDARQLLSALRREQWERSRFLARLDVSLGRSRVLFHLERELEPYVRTECLRIRLAAWMVAQNGEGSACPITLWVAGSSAFPYLRAYGERHGVRLRSYPRLPALPWRARFQALGTLLISRLRLARPTATPVVVNPPPRALVSASPGAPVGVRYWYRPLGFSPDQRTEFFWAAALPDWRPRLLLYQYQSPTGPTPTERTELEAYGVRVLGNAPGVTRWTPRRGFLRQAAWRVGCVLAAAARATAELRPPPPHLVARVAWLGVRVAYWEDFFRATGVRVNIGCLNTEVAQTIALANVGGVSVGYQYSASNIINPGTLLTAGEDIQFVFSPLFEEHWRTVGCEETHFLRSGFIFDFLRNVVPEDELDRELRRGFEVAGARFVLCFLDENSVQRWNVPAPHEEAMADYEFLLRWLLDDPELGLVFKPKKGDTLFERMGPLSSLIEEAEATGRCVFLNRLPEESAFSPARAARLADLCLGKLVGSTAAMEAWMVGVPTVLVDPDGYHTHPFWSWGGGKIVFSGWPELRSAVHGFRADPEGRPEFGDWSSGIHALASPLDGAARERIGRVVRRLSEALGAGRSREHAIAEALALAAQPIEPRAWQSGDRLEPKSFLPSIPTQHGV